jgi:hypothetical protein
MIEAGHKSGALGRWLENDISQATKLEAATIGLALLGLAGVLSLSYHIVGLGTKFGPWLVVVAVSIVSAWVGFAVRLYGGHYLSPSGVAVTGSALQFRYRRRAKVESIAREEIRHVKIIARWRRRAFGVCLLRIECSTKNRGHRRRATLISVTPAVATEIQRWFSSSP